MANAVQWTIDQFYGQLQNLKGQIDAADAELQADKLQLQTMYSQMAAAYDPSRDAFVAPLIHQNTVLRLTYLKPVKDKFNQAVAAASSAIRQAGYNTPGMAGMGVAPLLIIVPVVAITAVLLGLEAINIVSTMTASQRARTSALIATLNDPSKSNADKAAVAAALDQDAKNQRAANPPLLDPTQWITPLLIIAAIVMAPTILRSVLPARGQVTA